MSRKTKEMRKWNYKLIDFENLHKFYPYNIVFLSYQEMWLHLAASVHLKIIIN